MAKDKWSDARTEYVTSNLSYRQIADKYGIALRTLQRRASIEKWAEQRYKFNATIASDVENIAAAAKVAEAKTTIECAEDLLKIITAKMATIDKISARDIKALSSALRDINEVRGVKSAIDLEEQRARIEKYRRDADRDSDEAKQITVRIEGGGEWSQ